MKLVSIEPTPNPNSMKLNLAESLPKGASRTYTAADQSDCPDYIARLLEVPGVKSLFHMADFIAVQRHPSASWQPLLAAARRALGAEGAEDVPTAPAAVALDEAFGEVQVELQMFRHLPMLVKVSSGAHMHRKALPQRFTAAVNRAAKASPNMLAERRWVEQGVRYGELEQIAQEVAEEIDAAYEDERLEELVQKALEPRPADSPPPTPAASARLSDNPDWRVRYAALQKTAPRPEAIPLLTHALSDPHSSIRRMAVVLLGLTRDPAAVPPLCQALEDEGAAVRRTAGDALSDLADPRAIGPMTKALEDSNKLVRWRAARFLYESGDETALAGLRAREADPEFEVRMQVRLAIERIEGGQAGHGPVWQQMTR
ncbi:MAG TPA: virulence factor [Planctomycetota bacterium]|nr:virulence factor [Planctomycetota bacterium]